MCAWLCARVCFGVNLVIWFIIQTLMEDEPEKYQTHFSRFIKKGVESDGIEEMYKKVHAAIRADPTPKKSQKEPPKEHKRYCDIHLYIFLQACANTSYLSKDFIKGESHLAVMVIFLCMFLCWFVHQA